MLDILLFWASKNIDGFRCDMAEMVPVEFWEWAIPQVKEVYPEILFIAEVYNPSEYRNYLFRGRMIRTDVITAIIRLSGMFDDACIPYMCST